MALIMITHDLGVIAETVDRVVVMYGGRVMEEGPVQQIFDAPEAQLHAVAARQPHDGPRASPTSSETPARDAAPALELRDLSKVYHAEAARAASSARQVDFHAVREREPRPAAQQDRRARRRVRLGQDARPA